MTVKALTYDDVVKLLAPIAWAVIGLLGWSLNAQIEDFRARMAQIDSNVSGLGVAQQTLATGFAAMQVVDANQSAHLDRLLAESSKRGDEVARITVLVDELVQIRREERQRKP